MASLENPGEVLSELNSDVDGSQTTDAEKQDLLSRFVAWMKKMAAELKAKVLGTELDIDGKVTLEDLWNVRKYFTWYRHCQSNATTINSLTSLQPGDHIAVKTKRSSWWWNHMIVTDVDVFLDIVYVVCPCSTESDPVNAKVIFESDCISVKDIGEHCRIERKKPKLRVWEVALPWQLVKDAVKYNYRDSPYTPEQVVERARKELNSGESWDLYTMTSEEFASRVKTGQASNEQKYIQDQAIALGFEAGAKGAFFSIKNVCCVFKIMLRLARWILQLSFRNTPRVLAGIKVIAKICDVLKFLGLGIGAIVDCLMTISDIKLKYQRLKKGEITRNEFNKYVVQKLSEFITNAIFGVLSLLMFLIPIPIVGQVLSIVVSVVGWFLGKFISWLVGKMWDKVFKEKPD